MHCRPAVAICLLAAALASSSCRKKRALVAPTPQPVAQSLQEERRPAPRAEPRRPDPLLPSNVEPLPAPVEPAVRPPMRPVETTSESHYTPVNSSGRREPLWKIRAKNY